LIEAELQIHDNKIRRQYWKGDLTNPEVDDLLDDLGELVTKMAKWWLFHMKKCLQKQGLPSVLLLKIKQIMIIKTTKKY
jgi:hypothetical protein